MNELEQLKERVAKLEDKLNLENKYPKLNWQTRDELVEKINELESALKPFVAAYQAHLDAQNYAQTTFDFLDWLSEARPISRDDFMTTYEVYHCLSDNASQTVKVSEDEGIE